ncbi:LysR family transcriptional regulator [Oceanibaculum pacificum]|uniref:LysR family transcriptional regulator n=1 Tax=Oceanibaculum pacificum TaxID=580166 RepID=A0A154VI98_9PROT|nr:LysR family transcriptional regulator [Oceanibaculum pacificum]KZD01045.1 LysR family transcriptional regulator [Oceanibaculum pacificum]
MMPDLKSINVFVAVAEARSFRAAADRLGVTRSAVSQAINGLEARLGVALFQRTTRSVNLTEAGSQLYQTIGPALSDITTALQKTIDRTERPAGQLRLAVSSIAETFLSGPLLASFARTYPDIQLDIVITDEEHDIVAEGYDAGVRLGEVIEQDMIAIPVSDDQRQVAVCAPSYLARVDPPTHPRDLVHHRCVGWRPAPGVAPYRWEFSENGRDFDVAVNPEITTNDMQLMIRLACMGAGVTVGMEESFRPWLARGELVMLLEEFCPSFPGFFLYFSSRRNLAPKLRALVDFVKSR